MERRRYARIAIRATIEPTFNASGTVTARFANPSAIRTGLVSTRAMRPILPVRAFLRFDSFTEPLLTAWCDHEARSSRPELPEIVAFSESLVHRLSPDA